MYEIKTPVQAILGYSEMLMADPQTNTKYTNLIMHNALRIQKLLSNILDMAKIDNDSLMLDKERFNLEALVYNVIEDSKNQIAHLKKNLNILYNSKLQLKEDQGNETGLIIYADRDRLAQVLTNLLDNAIKFSDSGTIVVSISKSQSGRGL